MYGIVLATMLAAGGETPAWHWHSCHGCSSSCHGCYSTCHGCWSSCHGCRSSCHGCWSSCHGCYSSCHGCWSSCHGCCSCSGVIISSCHGCCSSCFGCCGGVVIIQESKPIIVKQAVVTIKVAEGAKFTVDGKPVEIKGVQTFLTPELDPAKVYTYTMKASAKKDGKEVSAEKSVKVKAGESISVDLTDLKPWKAPEKKPEEKEEVARITVKLPAEAKLYVEDVQCPLESTERTFDTPVLEKGKTYQYTLKAEVTIDGRKVEESRKVTVKAGNQVTVEFAKMPVQSAAR